MRHAVRLRGTLWLILGGCAGFSGCIHNHYYGSLPPCGPNGAPISSQVGQVCEVPGGQVVVSAPSSSSTSAGSSSSVVVQSPRQGANVTVGNQPRVLISQPAYGPSVGQSVSRFKWRSPDPDSVATTRVEGALEGETTRQ